MRKNWALPDRHDLHLPAIREHLPTFGRRKRDLDISRGALGLGSVGALALGATALGALAIGALAINRLAVRRARFERLSVGRLEVDQLVVRKHVTPEADDEGLLEA